MDAIASCSSDWPSDSPQTSDAGQSVDTDTFHFESDHVALKGNPDYHELLKTILVLEAQRTQAIKDLDVLVDKENEALEDPIGFVNKLQNKQDLGLPGPQNIPEIPEIQWERYTSNLSSLDWKHKHVTRNKRSSIDLHTALLKPQKQESELSSGANSEDDKAIIRGRFREGRKPVTFNKLWTAEEQKRLEDLLIKFPPEDVEMRRWEKIAKELNHRTAHQVQSRTQKYFIKLAKLGLPIPGRMPNVSSGRKIHKHHRHNRFYFAPSTFLASHEPPVYMSDDEGDGGESMYPSRQHQHYMEVSDEEDVPPELRQTEEYRQILELKKLKRQKLKSECEPAQHLGYKCDRCECEPITGTRWHCGDCPSDTAVDFCDDCVDFEFVTEHHSPSHQLHPVKQEEGGKAEVCDTDYSHRTFMPGGYNYLDPNYMPA